jgi:type II secretory pathway pseudopilin PulG
MAFVLINKIVVIVLIIALLILLFIKKKRTDAVFVLSVTTLFIWLINIIADGYFWVNFLKLSISQVQVLSSFDIWSKNAMYILMGIISVVLLVRASKRKDEKVKQQEAKKENISEDA